jgi:hypothetical protein
MRSKIASPLVAAVVAATVALALAPQPAVPVSYQPRPPLESVSPKAIARELLTPKQYACFTKLMGKESAWNPKAKNPESTARGIGQLLEPTYRNLGMRHSTHGVPQVVAALAYIGRKYGSAGPCGAWKHWQKHKWY